MIPKNITINLNWWGFYDIDVNGKRALEMVPDIELSSSIEYILKDPDGLVEEILREA
jgi:hypothetical protein